MKRNTLNFLVDLVSGLVLLGIITTGLILRFVLPPGSGRGRVLWIGNRHEWGDVHFWLAAAAGAVLLVHVALHWQWICVTAVRLFRRRKGEQAHPSGISRNVAGAALVVGLIGLFAGFVWFSRANVRLTGEGGMHRGRGDAAEAIQSGDRSEGELPFIRGSMTLGDVAAASGIPVETLRAKLNLPASISPDERLGRLRQEFGFTMEEVRKIVAAEQQKAAGSSRE
ncbi:MAG TPA: DUF4405 domain-containing protein [Tepidisphaeraceae bacterium]|nr:DUF4405 domain-containing protein [Tepidisphaeraceae bacterium]